MWFRNTCTAILNYIDAVRPISGTGIIVDDGNSGSPVNLAGSAPGAPGEGDGSSSGGGGGDDGLGVHALDVCHMGVPAKRDFRCSEAYSD